MVSNISLKVAKEYVQEYFPDCLGTPLIPDILNICIEYLVSIHVGWYENGQLYYEHPHVNGKVHGLCRSWYVTGLPLTYPLGMLRPPTSSTRPPADLSRPPSAQLGYEHNWVNGKKHGICKRWYDNGQLRYERLYVNGKKHGVWRWWYKNGDLQEEY
jgi:hypothetical protein